MLLGKYKVVSMLIFVLLLWSCKSTKQVTESEQISDHRQTDSVNLLVVERIITPIVTPQTTAKLNLLIDVLDSLPVGALFQARDGNATGTVIKNDDNTLTFIANCDSLIFLVEQLNKELYHSRSENTTLKTTLNEQKLSVVNELSGWQWFQIYGFRILLIIFLLIILWQKRIKMFKGVKNLLKSK